MGFDIVRNREPKLKVVYVSGSLKEIGEQYGEYLKKWYRASPLFLFTKIVDLFVEHSTLNRPQAVKTGMRQLIYRYIEKNVMNSLTPEMEELMKGLSRGSGISMKEIRRALSFADVFPHLILLGGMVNRSLFPQTLVGCSSFFGWGNFTRNGSLIHARNFDFFGGEPWEKNHSLIVLKPEGYNSSITVTSDSAIIPGVTTLIQNGTVFDLHLNYTRELSRRGYNIVSLAAAIAFKSKNLEDVESIIKSYSRFSGWGLLVSNPGFGGAIFEMNAKKFVRRNLQRNSYLYYNNTYHSPELKKGERVPAYVWSLFNIGRDIRMKELLKENFGEIDPVVAAKILGDHFDPWLKRERSTGSVISCVYNSSSAIFDVEEDTIYVANGVSPVNNNYYFPVSITDLWYGRLKFKGDPVPPNNFVKGNRISALRHYVKAYYRWWYDLDMCGALEHLDEAIHIDPSESQYFFIRAMMRLKAGYVKEAKEDIEQFLAMKLTEYRRQIGALWEGRIADLNGNRNYALKIYKRLSKSKFPDVMKWANRQISKPYSWNMVKRLDVDFVLGEFFDY